MAHWISLDVDHLIVLDINNLIILDINHPEILDIDHLEILDINRLKVLDVDHLRILDIDQLEIKIKDKTLQSKYFVPCILRTDDLPWHQKIVLIKVLFTLYSANSRSPMASKATRPVLREIIVRRFLSCSKS